MVSVYIQSPKWLVRPRNTDWRYTRFMLPRISEFIPDCRFYRAQSRIETLRSNWRFVRSVLYRKLKISHQRDYRSVLDRKEFFLSNCDLVFNHDDFPKNAQSISVIWQNSILDPEMSIAYGRTEEQIGIECEMKREGFSKAAAVQVSSEAERMRLGQWFPDIAAKFVAIPFFLPDVVPIEQIDLEKKNSRNGQLHCLFVGHEARRKGLMRVYAAMQRLPDSIQRQIHLTVVSRFSDGPIRVPPLLNVEIEGEATHERVLQLMRESDVFLMPSYFESFGLVYLEAMAQGTIPVVPNWEVQREIVNYGQAGVITSGDAGDLASSLERLCDERDWRLKISANAKCRFVEHYAPSIVAAKYGLLFRSFSRFNSEVI